MNNKNENVVFCGMNKWSISINDYGQLVIYGDHYPINCKVTLSDLSYDDCKNLAALFARQARYMRLASPTATVEPKT